MRKAGFWFTLWAGWTAIYMTELEFSTWLYHKGYTLRRDPESGKVVPCKYLPEWWYLTGGGRGSPANPKAKPRRWQMICDDCEQPTDWVHAIQHDPWGRPTGECFCENCAEKRWDRQQEKLMEET